MSGVDHETLVSTLIHVSCALRRAASSVAAVNVRDGAPIYKVADEIDSMMKDYVARIHAESVEKARELDSGVWDARKEAFAVVSRLLAVPCTLADDIVTAALRRAYALGYGQGYDLATRAWEKKR